MIKLEYPVIVEGKYDKITLENVIDATIIPTNGFSLFKDKDKCNMIRALAQKKGIIVLTDSDSAGNMIRAYIKKIAGSCRIINLYTPRISGKEKRKPHSGKEGILGVEGMDTDLLKELFSSNGINFSQTDDKTPKITKNDLYFLGLSGGENCTEKRKELLKEIGLPENLSSSAMLDVVNTLYTPEEFQEVINKWQAEN